jgi:hypothetical protein
MTNQDIIRRLAYIKYLYQAGIEQSKQPDVTAYTSILSFHDSIDWFMNLACLKLGITDKDKKRITGKSMIALMDYFTIIPTLTLGSSVDKINKRRNNLKHDFQIPAPVEIEECKSIATLFFEENTKLIFDLTFTEISLFDLISFPAVKQKLIVADKFLAENKITEAVVEITIAFRELIAIDSNHKRESYGYTLSAVKKWGFQSIQSNLQRSGNPSVSDAIENISTHVKKVTDLYDKNFESISESLKILFLGFDYRKYTKFKNLTPVVIELYGGPMVQSVDTKKLTSGNMQFLFDFVLECALKMQQFEYNP